MLKIVGTPAMGNYDDLRCFPAYAKVRMEKKYKRNVSKALLHVCGKDKQIEAYAGIIKVLDKVWHLDPHKRAKADEVLNLLSEKKVNMNEFLMEWKLLKDEILMENGASDEKDAGMMKECVKRKLDEVEMTNGRGEKLVPDDIGRKNVRGGKEGRSP